MGMVARPRNIDTTSDWRKGVLPALFHRASLDGGCLIACSEWNKRLVIRRPFTAARLQSFSLVEQTSQSI